MLARRASRGRFLHRQRSAYVLTPGLWTKNAYLEDGHGGDWEEGPQFSLLCAKLRGESQKFECCQIKVHSPNNSGNVDLEQRSDSGRKSGRGTVARL